MDRLGIAHTALACVALALGAIVVLRRKGDRLHRTTGHLYVASLVATNITALNIYDLFGQVGPFHVAAIVSLATVVAGMIPVVTRRPRARWFETHAYFMSWSYVGLVAAAGAEAAVRLPAVPFGPAAFAATLLVTLAGALLIHGHHGARVQRALRRAGVLSAVLALPAAPRATLAQSNLDSLIDRLRIALESSASRGDGSAITTVRQQLARLAAAHPSHGLLLHYLGYAWYREAMLGDTANRAAALDSAEAALERSARVLTLAETHALRSTVIGQQIGGSPWKGMLRGSSVATEIEKAMRLDPENPRVALQRGINAFYTPPAFGGGMDRARAAFERAIALFPRHQAPALYPAWGHAEAWAWLGRTRARAGDRSGALAAYETALRIDSTYAWVSRDLKPALDRR
jgi:uncharacterized membrane protein/tetratricopeptide (TPR) repeat protein